MGHLGVRDLGEKELGVLDVRITLGPDGPVDVASGGAKAPDLRRTLLFFLIGSSHLAGDRGLGVAPAQQVVDVGAGPLLADTVY